MTVFADEAAADAEAEKQPADDPAAIAYLKEQQWTNEFATAPVREVELRSVDPGPGVDRAADGWRSHRCRAGRGTLRGDVAAVDRRRRFAPGRPSAGWSRGCRPATIARRLPPTWREAQVALEAARAEQARAERLLADRAVPARRVEDARRAVGRRGSAAAGGGSAAGAAR